MDTSLCFEWCERSIDSLINLINAWYGHDERNYSTIEPMQDDVVSRAMQTITTLNDNRRKMKRMIKFKGCKVHSLNLMINDLSYDAKSNKLDLMRALVFKRSEMREINKLTSTVENLKIMMISIQDQLYMLQTKDAITLGRDTTANLLSMVDQYQEILNDTDDILHESQSVACELSNAMYESSFGPLELEELTRELEGLQQLDDLNKIPAASTSVDSSSSEEIKDFNAANKSSARLEPIIA